ADGLLYENVVKPMLGQQSDAALTRRLVENFHRSAQVLDRTLEDHDYLVGDHVTLADLSVVTAFMYARAAQIPVAEHRPFVAWMARLEARPSWKATEPPPMKM